MPRSLIGETVYSTYIATSLVRGRRVLAFIPSTGNVHSVCEYAIFQELTFPARSATCTTEKYVQEEVASFDSVGTDGDLHYLTRAVLTSTEGAVCAFDTFNVQVLDVAHTTEVR